MFGYWRLFYGWLKLNWKKSCKQERKLFDQL
jgi:hypothetical protein